jgi:AraC-like DNA-binding protein
MLRSYNATQPIARTMAVVPPERTTPAIDRGDVGLLLDLFGDVPHVMVCVKDAHGRYVAANQAFVRRARCRHPSEVLGRCAGHLFEPSLAASYDAQDRTVLRTGLAIRNHLEPIEDRSGGRRWYLTSKRRAAGPGGGDGPDGAVVVVVSVEAQLGGDAASGVRAAVELAHARFPHPTRVSELAAAAGMSTDRLERAMRRALGLSPKQYLVRLRAERAAQLLAADERPIAQVAAECGYYDQSQLTRQLRAQLGMTPAEYRAASR